MTWITQQFDDATRRPLDKFPDLRWIGQLIGKSIYGPTPTMLVADPDIRRNLQPNLVLAEDSNQNAHALGSFRTFWVLNPADPDVGIWAVNVTSNASILEMRDAGAPMVTGYYGKIGKIPAPEVMRTKFDKLSFAPGFREQYSGFYPDPLQVAADKAAADKAAEDARISEALKPIERPAKELTVVDNTIIANKTAEESAADEAHPGVPLAGKGAWKRFVGNKSPKSFGLPGPLLAFQEDTGDVKPATEEYESIVEAAKRGDEGAKAALDYLGLTY